MTERGTAFIIAESRGVAESFLRERQCERRPWGWSDPATGRRLVFLDRPDQLRGMPRGLLAYCLHGYNRRRDWDEINWALDNREAQRVFYP